MHELISGTRQNGKFVGCGPYDNFNLLENTLHIKKENLVDLVNTNTGHSQDSGVEFKPALFVNTVKKKFSGESTEIAPSPQYIDLSTVTENRNQISPDWF